MKKTAIMTDSNCGLMPVDGSRLGIYVIPMPVLVDDQTYYEGQDITVEEFYKKLSEGAKVSTSQPSPGDVMEMWNRLLKDYDEVVYIPMSSGLSSTYQNASLLAQEEPYAGKVYVVNNHRISVTQAQSALDAKLLADQGKNGAYIKRILEEESMDATIYIVVDTLEYLKKGGRITPAVSAIGSMLKLKPVLTIQGEKLDMYVVKRGMKAAFKEMCKALDKDINTRLGEFYHSGQLKVGIANTAMEADKLEYFKSELKNHFPDLELVHLPLTMSIGSHVGPGGLGIGLVRAHV